MNWASFFIGAGLTAMGFFLGVAGAIWISNRGIKLWR